MTPWLAEDLRHTISETLGAAEAVGAPQTWVLSNHDVVRHATRLGFEQSPGLRSPRGIGADDPQPDPALGLRRARAATTVMLGLPGSAYLYQGEELGLPDATRLPDDVRQDPTWERSNHTQRGRDGCRVPMPWEGSTPSLGFGPGAEVVAPPALRVRRPCRRPPARRRRLDPRAVPAAALAPPRAAPRPWIADLVRHGFRRRPGLHDRRRPTVEPCSCWRTSGRRRRVSRTARGCWCRALRTSRTGSMCRSTLRSGRRSISRADLLLRMPPLRQYVRLT